jgi:hypothetical protein
MVCGVAIASACNYDNPGFKIKETDTGVSLSEVSGSSLEATSQPSPTTTQPTSSETTMTSAGPQVSGSDSDTSSTSPGTSETSTADATTGPGEPWDNLCNDPVVGPNMLPVADTYFLNTIEMQPTICAYNDIDMDKLADVDCVHVNAGKVASLPMVFNDGGSENTPNDDLVLAFGARFKYDLKDDKDVPVPWTAVIDSTLELYFFRANDQAPWDPPEFALYPLLPAETDPPEPVYWEEGAHLKTGACAENEPTFGCLMCLAVIDDEKCAHDWFWPGGVFEAGKGTTIGDPFDLGAEKPDGARIKVVELGLPGTEQALGTGVLVVARSKVIWEDKLELKSKEYNQGKVGPFLRVKYCPNPN